MTPLGNLLAPALQPLTGAPLGQNRAPYPKPSISHRTTRLLHATIQDCAASLPNACLPSSTQEGCATKSRADVLHRNLDAGLSSLSLASAPSLPAMLT